ncbi:MAG TPA: hypothetical protein DDZ53_12805 [Firmicutes bacterium]|nr:hypothetical protein [Bacillota bacterium]
MNRKAFIFMLFLSTLSVLVAAYAGSRQENPRFQYPNIFTYANLLIVSGFCWGGLLQGYLVWGSTSISQRVWGVTLAVMTLALAFGLVLPPVMLLNTGPVPDSLASCLMAATGFIPGAILILVIWLLQRLFNACR